MKQYRFGPNGPSVSRTLFKVIFAATLVFTVAGCDEPAEEDPALTDATPTPTPTPNPTTSGSPLSFSVSTRWEGISGGEFSLVKKCEVDVAAARGSVDVCEISIEEAKMFYSDIRFTVATANPSRCRVNYFQPYFYRRSTSATYVAPGDADVTDCTAADTPVKCFGGAAPGMIANFPKITGYYSLTALGSTIDFDIKASSTLRNYGGYKVNYMITNDLLDPSQAASAGAGREYVVGSWVDYKVVCSDEWGFAWHTINILIQDEDKEGFEDHAEDEFNDWD